MQKETAQAKISLKVVGGLLFFDSPCITNVLTILTTAVTTDAYTLSGLKYINLYLLIPHLHEYASVHTSASPCRGEGDDITTDSAVTKRLYCTNKKAELTPGLARDRAPTWRLIMNWDSQQRLKL